MALNMVKIMQDAVLEGKVPAKAVAAEIGKPYPTLMRELNPYDSGAKLGLETFLEIIRVTGDIGPLRMLAMELNCAILPMACDENENENHAYGGAA